MFSQFLILADFPLDLLPVLAAVNAVLLQVLTPAPIFQLYLEVPHDLLLGASLLSVDECLFGLLNGDLAAVHPGQLTDYPLVLNTLS